MTTSTPTIHLSFNTCEHETQPCEEAFENRLESLVRAADSCDIDLEGGWSATVPNGGTEYAIEVWKVNR